ncbi:MAG: 2-phospho-L-lactate transferase, partial [Ardenticatenaceae bacterium]
GLHVSPDLDTVMYTLSGLANPETGWGVAGDTFQTLERLRAYGADAWFNLGDRDFATHIRRTEMLGQGYTLSQVTEALARSLGIQHPIVPMSNDDIRTRVATDEGELRFQEYFVKRHCEPEVKALRFDGAERAKPSPGFIEALEGADFLIICPSNPFLSIAPILAVPGVRNRIEKFPGLRAAVSPIVGGQALRGPAAKMLSELGHDVSCAGVAKQYAGICDVFVIDNADRELSDAIAAMGMRVEVTDTLMTSDADKERLAGHIFGLRESLASTLS